MPAAPLEDIARLAIDGDRDALEELVKALQADVYGLALRMLWNREDAEDATQEILVRTVTRLSQFDFRSRLKTWVYRIAVNCVLDVKRSPVERLHLTFGRFAEELVDGLSSEGPADAERSVLTEEVKINSHGGQYAWPAEQFVKRGFAVYALDLRGRGKSEGERFYLEDVAEYVSDVAGTVKIAKSRESGLPVFLLGHSAGGVVSCVYALENQAELTGFICESFAFQVPAPSFVLAAVKGLSHLARRLPALTLKNEDFSRDPKAVEALNNDPLIAHEKQPAITVAALVRADERLREEFPLITLPVLIMHGTADKATSAMAANSSTRPPGPGTRRSSSTRGTTTIF